MGAGLNAMGLVPAGGTYSVLASEIIESPPDWGESFVGHIHVLADYTDCNGVGWVTDFGTVNQAYVAVVVDSDTGWMIIKPGNSRWRGSAPLLT